MEKQFDLFEKSVSDKFNEFDRKNPNVYELFKKYGLEMIHKTTKKVSHKLIVERLRWEFYFKTEDDNSDFKINNNYTAYYGRKFIREFPQYTDRFNFRILKSQ